MNKKLGLSIIVFLMFVYVNGVAQTYQKGTVVEYLGQRPKSVLSGVQIIAYGAGSTITDNEGKYTLRFNNGKDGKTPLKFLNTVWKDSRYELFTKDRVIGRVVSSVVPLEIILVRTSFLKQQKEAESKKQIVKYEKERDKAVSAAKAALAQEQVTKERCQAMIDSVTNDYYKKLHDLNEFLEQFVHCDFSQLNDTTSKILKLLDEGNVSEASRQFNKLNIADKIHRIVERRNVGKRLVNKSDSTINSLFEQTKIYVMKLMLEGKKENFDVAGAALKQFALGDTTNLAALMEYSNFAYNQKNYEDALLFYCKALNRITLLYDHNPDLYRASLAIVQNCLGNCYRALRVYEKSETYYLKAIVNKEQLCNLYPEIYRADLARTQHNLGVLYKDIGSYDKSEEYLRKAFENYENLFAQNPDAYRKDLSMTQNSLGNLYYVHGAYDKSESYYKEALANYETLSIHDSVRYKPYIAKVQDNIGSLYFQKHLYDESEQYYQRALDIRNYLFGQNPDASRNDLSITQHNLALLYYYTSSYEKAEMYFKMAIVNRDILYARFPKIYVLDIVASYNGLSLAQAKRNDFVSSLTNIDKAIKMSPKDANLYDTKGEILLMKGDAEGALQMWQTVLKLNPKFMESVGGPNGYVLYKGLKQIGLID